MTTQDWVRPNKFGFSSVFVRKRKVGRPRTKGNIDKIRVRLWYWYVSLKLSLKSAYALEIYFSYVVIKEKKTDAGAKELSGKWKQYRRGLVVPHPILVTEVEKCCPGSRFLLEHPVWRIISPDIYAKPDFNAALRQLSPEIVNLLFRTAGNEEHPRLERNQFSEKLITNLTSIGDLDAFAACLAIVQESLIKREIYPYCIATRGAVTIILGLSCFLPMWYVADDLFEYLKKYLFYIKTGTDIDLDFCTINLFSYQRIQNSIINMLEDFGLLKPNPRVHLACLIVSRQIGLNEVYQCLSKYWHSNQYDKVKHDPMILNLQKRLRRMKHSNTKTTHSWP